MRSAKGWKPAVTLRAISISPYRDNSLRRQNHRACILIPSIGGNYDGLAGVLAGVAVLAAMQRAGVTKIRKLRVLGFRGEESPWFNQAYLGSRLLLGELTHDELKALRRFDTGKSLAEHIAGLEVDLPTGKLEPTIELSQLKAYFELHIEQAPLLENLGRPIGIATAIRGNIRYPFAKCIGHYAHSGAMPRRFRRDALIATAKLISFADERWPRDQLWQRRPCLHLRHFPDRQRGARDDEGSGGGGYSRSISAVQSTTSWKSCMMTL